MGIVEDTLNAQGVIQPGTEGWWEVFGARAQDIRPGDRVMVRWIEGDTVGCDEYAVEELAPRGDTVWDVARPRFRAPDGTLFSIGAFQPIAVLRWGTRHTLADSI